jgi:hypothetical protein
MTPHRRSYQNVVKLSLSVLILLFIEDLLYSRLQTVVAIGNGTNAIRQTTEIKVIRKKKKNDIRGVGDTTMPNLRSTALGDIQRTVTAEGSVRRHIGSDTAKTTTPNASSTTAKLHIVFSTGCTGYQDCT